MEPNSTETVAKNNQKTRDIANNNGNTDNTKGGVDANNPMPEVVEPINSSDGGPNRPALPGEMNCTEDEDGETNCEMPEPPEGFDGQMPGNMGPGGMMGGRFPGETVQASSDSILHPVGYLTLGAGSVILALVISYVIFSHCFKKRPGKAFSSLQKFLYFILVALVIAAGLIALSYFVPIWVS